MIQCSMTIADQVKRQQHLRNGNILQPVGVLIIIIRAKARRSIGKVVDLRWIRKKIELVTLGRVTSPSDSFMVKLWKFHGW